MRCGWFSILATFLGWAWGKVQQGSESGGFPYPSAIWRARSKPQRAPATQNTRFFTNDDLSTLPHEYSAHRAIFQDYNGEKTVEKRTGEDHEARRTRRPTAISTIARRWESCRTAEIDRRELRVIEQEAGPESDAYYPDPQKGLLQESGPLPGRTFYKLQTRLPKKKADVRRRREAIENLREQLAMKAATPPGFVSPVSRKTAGNSEGPADCPRKTR